MRPPRFRILPRWHNALLALIGAGLLILAFPDFEWWWTAWFALVPLMWAIEREGKAMPSFMLGWLFGTTYFFGTCWWLTYAPIHYAGVPPWLAYLLVITACILAGLFPGLFAAILARLLRRFGTWAYFAAPFVWVFTEFARYWLTGNNWNAIGYSQFQNTSAMHYAPIAGLLAVSFAVIYYNLVARALILIITALAVVGARRLRGDIAEEPKELPREKPMFALINDDPDEVKNTLTLAALLVFVFFMMVLTPRYPLEGASSRVIAIQPNVPASGLDQLKWQDFRNRQFAAVQNEIDKLSPRDREWPTAAILPESPMNFAYNDDREFQRYVREFTTKNKVSLLFNSAEPDRETGKYFNSAVMVGPDGNKIAQYDKLYLLPFGEAVPFPFEGLMPPVVGSFAYGKNYSLVPVGDAKAGVMICFESHFGQLGREQVKQGADVIIEMTNDGYLGPTPVLRQHLANAVFRAVETNRPVLRVTNVGITAYITRTGQLVDPAPTYQEAVRVWSVSKSDGSQTFYVKYGDWFAWLCTVVTIVLLLFSFRKKKAVSAISA